jgi:septum formation topological specificity factor MinE
VFIRVRIDNLKELSISIPEIVNKEDKINKDNININKEMKNLFTSSVVKIELENSSLLT